MYLHKILALSIFMLLVTLNIGSCDKKTDTTSRSQGIFTVLQGDSILLMNGVINSNSLHNFNALYARFSSIKKIEIKTCEGSMDDETNLKLSKRVHELRLNTHLQDNGLIASGGVDFFLAGIQRSKGTNVTVGVHSWSDGGSIQATDFPVGHANHLPYINYYISIGFSQQWAEDFYYFTINAAPASGIHNMTAAELQTYTIFTS
ncbi:hypothetical protein [Aureispira anguillae]|uniref:Uncharacterized protein n=1 Tax=Aureispira anguillae TaxID=2864201 RepID=A0A915YIL2_9BACT|nr:hypothetical protein [Aureispira anguillae]BDS13844.1 hypothetical protein AsAng_0046060 [Aureispira anguillae]